MAANIHVQIIFFLKSFYYILQKKCPIFCPYTMYKDTSQKCLYGLHGFYGKTSDLTKPKQWLPKCGCAVCVLRPSIKRRGTGNKESAKGQWGDVKTALTNEQYSAVWVDVYNQVLPLLYSSGHLMSRLDLHAVTSITDEARSLTPPSCV